MNKPFISIIIPTYNEEKNLPRLFASLARLDYPKNKREIIIVDGYSTDRTVALAQKFGAKVFFNPGRIRTTGCQIGIDKARGEMIAFTDADCVVPSHWLKGLLEPLKGKKIAAVGGPNITPKNDTPFAKAAGEVMWLLTRTGARYGFSGKKVVEIYHNPGCNVLYRKKAIQAVGGFNPRLLTCEDEELDFRLGQKGYKLLFTPKVVVDHYRRPTYKKTFIQAYRYAIGRAQATRLHPKMARWFHFVPSILLLFFPSLFFVLPALLAASVFLRITKKTASFDVYFFLLTEWWLGYGIGFWRGLLFFNPQNRKKK